MARIGKVTSARGGSIIGLPSLDTRSHPLHVIVSSIISVLSVFSFLETGVVAMVMACAVSFDCVLADGMAMAIVVIGELRSDLMF